jgi:2,3-bisphosphoglycerate-dependent phosphoglycerate mutase
MIYLVRHGETEWNSHKRYQGQTEVELNERGRRQAAQLADRLAKVRFHAAYTSDLARAKACADQVCAFHGLDAVPLAELRERHFGDLEGLTREEAQKCSWWGDFEDSDGFISPPGGGETRLELRRRVVDCLERIIEEHEGENILIFTHGGVIGQIIGEILGIPRGRKVPVRLDNCSLTVIKVEGTRRALLALNDVSHLHPEPPFGLQRFQEDKPK